MVNDPDPDNVHVPVKLPVPLLVNLMVPVGVWIVPGELSVIVAMHDVAVPIAAGAVHETATAAFLGETETVVFASGLAA